MATTGESVQPLEYSQPLYIGQQSYRSRKGIFFFITFSIFDIAWFGVSMQAKFQQPHGRLIFLLLGISFALIPIGLGFAIALNVHQTTFVIESGGIKIGRKFVPWEKIKRFGASVHSMLFWKSLQLFYCTEQYPKGFHLLNSNPISQEEYEHLIENLHDRIGHYGELKLGGYEKLVSIH